MIIIQQNLDKRKNVTLALLFILNILGEILFSQSFIAADPRNIVEYEQTKYFSNEYFQTVILRPQWKKSNISDWVVILRNELFINDNQPNLENIGNRWMGREGRP